MKITKRMECLKYSLYGIFLGFAFFMLTLILTSCTQPKLAPAYSQSMAQSHLETRW